MAGGRDVLKIISIDEDLNMKIAKNLHSRQKSNLDYGAKDIQWNQLNEKYVITSSFNNSINVWDIETGLQIKKPFKEHTKQNKLSWDPFNQTQFISGSTDTLIKLWDIKMESSVITMQRMKSRDDQVNFVQFNPKRQYQFAAGQGDGTIDIWDLRMTQAPKFSFQSHLKQVLCLDWHPNLEDILMSGSVDKYVKIWNLRDGNSSITSSNTLFQILTPQSITKCQWVPGLNLQLASLNNNSADQSSVNIWHCKKPYLQQYIYKCQKESILDFEWLHISSTIRPYERLCTTAIDYNLLNELAIINDRIISRDPDVFLNTLDEESNIEEVLQIQQQQNQMQRAKKQGGNQQTKTLKSVQGDYKESSKFEDLRIFSKLTTRSDEPHDDFSSNFESLSLELKFRCSDDKQNDLEDICLSNSRVAQSYGMNDVSLTWQSLRDLATELKSINTSIQQAASNKLQYIQEQKIKREVEAAGAQEEKETQQKQKKTKKKKNKNNQIVTNTLIPNDIEGGLIDAKSAEYRVDARGKKIFENDNIEVQMFEEIVEEDEEAQQNQDAFGVDLKKSPNTILDVAALQNLMGFSDQSQQNMKLRRQSSSSSKRNKKKEVQPNIFTYQNLGLLFNTNNNGEADMKFNVVFGCTPQRQIPLREQEYNHHLNKKKQGKLAKPVQPTQGQRKFQKTVADTIESYANNGDIQTSAFISLAFYNLLTQDQFKNYLSRVIITYLELLRNLQMFAQAREIIQFGPNLPIIDKKYKVRIHILMYKSQKDKGFVISTLCQFCGTSEEQSNSTQCSNPKCKKVYSRCSICNVPVKTLYVWCQGCSHGGHYNHMLKWLKDNNTCPAGCGHICKY
ncbi:wd repeat-containing protein 24 [Stylonychia lemnae]|uniref:Wd repeat-containing protein 24 n=1 Tax=Stylonychia lemnae TaxID=5949 RepID=A0A078AQD9_STYLE|nr:wd repeat-containing protein 24 [Stylonychia lemnae]|eukprot:CDW83462.1 wd repeat-containing protein 24 [Stylonychia lemnae]